MIKEYIHIPIMLNECIEALNIKPNGIYVDCTTNRGGHAIEIVKRLGENGRLICIDLDAKALIEAKERIEAKNHPRIDFINDNYRNIISILKSLNIEKVDGILADLGISSEELDISGRGFSFMRDEPLYMTFKDEKDIDDDTVTAEYILNNWEEDNIAAILWGYADEMYRGRIARAICEARQVKAIKSTTELVEIIKNVVPGKYKSKRGSHFATRTFQALRMAVNDELGGVKDLIKSLPLILKDEARAAVITFHSTEDRIVKISIKENNLEQVNKKPIVPSDKEVIGNPRSRSAKLRIIKLTTTKNAKNKYNI